MTVVRVLDCGRCPRLGIIGSIELCGRSEGRLVRRLLKLGIHRREARIVESDSAGCDQTDEGQSDERRDRAVNIPP